MTSISMFQLPRLGFTILLCALPAAAAEKITYEDHVFPLLEANCLNCHNPDKKKGGLDLSTYQGTIAGGSGGKIAITGDGASSKLFTVSVHTEEPLMPPEGDQLEKKQTDLLRKWIDGGLLETQSSKKKKPKKPTFSLAAVADPRKRPEGPPPMPENLLREPVVTTSRSSVINDMEASPWAPLLAITGQRQVLLYHTNTLDLIGVLPFPSGNPESLTFHPSGKYLIAGGGVGGKSGTTVTWEILNGKILTQQGREFDSVLAADIHPDLGTLALGGPSRILKIRDTRQVEEKYRVKKHTDWITALRYSLDGKLLASADRNGGLLLWDSATAEEYHTLNGHKESIIDVKWRSDGNVLATASQDQDLIVWDVKRGKQIKKIQAHPGGVLAMDYGQQGLIITSGRDRKVKFWKHDLGFRQELPVFKEEVTEVEFSHDGKRFFTATWSGQIQAWNVEGFKVIGELLANPPRIADRLVSLKNDLNRLDQRIQEKKNALTEQETLFAQATEPDPLTEKLIEQLKGEYDAMNTERTQISQKQKLWFAEQKNIGVHAAASEVEKISKEKAKLEETLAENESAESSKLIFEIEALEVHEQKAQKSYEKLKEEYLKMHK